MTTSSNPSSAGSERVIDWLLQALTVLVLTTLVACVVFLAWRWLGPQNSNTSAVTLTPIDRSVPALAREGAAEPSGDEVLVKPDQMYRCEGGGEVGFSDRPCTQGRARVMELPIQP
ncbi:MAG TPA: hypothetical protein PLQ67_01775 [Burkholderiaceae bacterium]|nr:hypothetical protein [Burkholderiaceae bacterium]